MTGVVTALAAMRLVSLSACASIPRRFAACLPMIGYTKLDPNPTITVRTCNSSRIL
jgi:hypothetical protein